MDEEERVSCVCVCVCVCACACVCVCSAVVLKAIYQDVVLMVRGLTVFSSPVLSASAAVNQFQVEEFGSTAGCVS